MRLSAALLLLVLCAPASAEEPKPDYARLGPYASVTGNFQLENYNVTGLQSGDTDTSAGFSIRGGYRFHPQLSAELQYEWMHDFIEDALDLGDAWLLGPNLRAYLAKGRIQPSFVLGANWMRGPFPAELGGGTRNSFALRFGIGFDIYATEHIVIHADGSYVQPTSDGLSQFPFGSIGGGFGYRF